MEDAFKPDDENEGDYEYNFIDSIIDTVQGPALTLKNATGIDAARLHTRSPHEGVSVVQGAEGAGK